MYIRSIVRSTVAFTALACLAVHPANAQVVNGDFSAGNTGFSTDYTFIPANHTVNSSFSHYSVISNPATAFTNGYDPFGDHTTGTGLMLWIDGSDNNNNRIWYQTVAVIPNTSYTFSAWASVAGTTNPPTLNFYTDATLLGNLVVSTSNGLFQQFSTSFTTGNTSSIVLAIRDNDTHTFGNDFAIDDISLIGPAASNVPEPSSVALLIGLVTIGAGFVRKRRSRS